MKMPNYNLPPGVSINDIPGNRPEDELWELFLNDIGWDEERATDRRTLEELFDRWRKKYVKED